MSLTLTLNGAFRAVLGLGLLGSGLGTRQQACLLCLEGPVHAGRLPALTPSSSCSDDPPQPALQGEGSGRLEGAAGKLQVDAQGGRCRAPGLAVAAVSGSAGCLYQRLVVQKGTDRELLGCRENPCTLPVGPAPRVLLSHAFSWCVFNFLKICFSCPGSRSLLDFLIRSGG